MIAGTKLNYARNFDSTQFICNHSIFIWKSICELETRRKKTIESLQQSNCFCEKPMNQFGIAHEKYDEIELFLSSVLLRTSTLQFSVYWKKYFIPKITLWIIIPRHSTFDLIIKSVFLERISNVCSHWISSTFYPPVRKDWLGVTIKINPTDSQGCCDSSSRDEYAIKTGLDTCRVGLSRIESPCTRRGRVSSILQDCLANSWLLLQKINYLYMLIRTHLTYT